MQTNVLSHIKSKNFKLLICGHPGSFCANSSLRSAAQGCDSALHLHAAMYVHTAHAFAFCVFLEFAAIRAVEVIRSLDHFAGALVMKFKF
jgi:hypothetical protein